MTAEIYVSFLTLAFIVIDYVSGIISAIVHKNLSSEKMRQGLLHKSVYIIIMAIATLIDLGELYIPLGFDAPVFLLACTYIILIEISSILENILLIDPTLKDTKLFSLFIVKEASHGK